MSGGLNRRFWTLWASFTASNLGDGFSLVAMPLVAISLTDDARQIAAVAAAQFLPFLVVGLPAGVVIDRTDRRVIALAAQGVRAVVAIAVAVGLLTDSMSIALLATAAFVLGSSEVLTDGALPALVRNVVPSDRLEVANARLIASQRVANQFVGPPLGALLFVVDSALPFALAGAAALVASGFVAALRGNFIAEQAGDDALPMTQRILVGLRFVLTHDVIRPLVIAVGVFSFVGSAVNATYIVLLTERFGFEPTSYGLLLSVDAAASVFMSFFVARLIATTSHSTSMRFAIVCFCVAAATLGLTTSASIVFVAAFVNGLSDPAWNVVSGTVRQRLVPDEVFGRMMTAYLFVAWGLKPVGAITAGVIAERWGPQWVQLLGAIVVASMFVLARPMFRRVDASMAGGTGNGSQP